MKKLTVVLALLMLAAGFLQAKNEDKILVKVNDEIILQSDVDEALEMAQAQLKMAGKPGDAADLKKKILEGMVEQKLIITMAKDENIAISEEAVADKVNEYLDGLRAKFPNEQAFEEALAQEGLSYTDFRIKIEGQVRDTLVYGKVKQKKQQDFISKSAVSDAEIASYYEKNKDAFKVNDEMNISQIFLAAGEVETDNLAKYAADLKARVDAGEAFEKVMQELNGKKGVTTAELGWINTNDLDARLRASLKNPKKGKVTAPIEIPSSGDGKGGFHLLKIVDYKKGTVSALNDEIREKVRVKIISEKVEKMWSEWIDTVKKEAYIKYM